jgi:N-acetylglucosaminyldiphosphoundecaprenol N-acetyl-beta-D-mannosaminyltransferase
MLGNDKLAIVNFEEPVLNAESFRLFGAKISVVDQSDILSLIQRSIDQNSKVVIASQNMHGLYMHFQDEHFAELHNKPNTIVHIDGTPIIWMSKAFGHRVNYRHRTGWVDWIYSLMALCEQNKWRVYILGNTQDVNEVAIKTFQSRYPGLDLDGRDGYFDAEKKSTESRNIVKAINNFRPNILIVGMGMGRQEKWILENQGDLEVNIIGTCGACMEVVAGSIIVSPRWMGRLGLEWLYRLFDTPSRVWKRYLVEPWVLLGFIIVDTFRKKH